MVSDKNLSLKIMMGLLTVVMVTLLLIGSTAGVAESDGTASACTCHGVEGTAVTITVTGLPDSYVADHEYNVTVSVSDEAIPSGSQGIWISADKGDLEATDLILKDSGGGLVHNETSASEWAFNWTAPVNGSGQVTLTFVSLVGDGVGMGGDDSWGTVEFTINQYGGPPVIPPDYTNDIIFATIIGTGASVIIFILVIGSDIRDRRKNDQGSD